MRDATTLTSGQAARLLGLGTGTVTKMADEGVLPSWRVPCSTHRRFDLKDVMAMAEAAGMPLYPEAMKRKRGEA